MNSSWKEKLTEYQEERKLTRKQKIDLESIFDMCCDLTGFEKETTRGPGPLNMAIGIFESPNSMRPAGERLRSGIRPTDALQAKKGSVDQ